MNNKNGGKPLTDWEVGQMLIKWSDEMCDSREFKKSHPEVWNVIDKCRRDIGDEFAKLKSHSFGIYNSKSKRIKESETL